MRFFHLVPAPSFLIDAFCENGRFDCGMFLHDFQKGGRNKGYVRKIAFKKEGATRDTYAKLCPKREKQTMGTKKTNGRYAERIARKTMKNPAFLKE